MTSPSCPVKNEINRIMVINAKHHLLLMEQVAINAPKLQVVMNDVIRDHSKM